MTRADEILTELRAEYETWTVVRDQPINGTSARVPVDLERLTELCRRAVGALAAVSSAPPGAIPHLIVEKVFAGNASDAPFDGDSFMVIVEAMQDEARELGDANAEAEFAPRPLASPSPVELPALPEDWPGPLDTRERRAGALELYLRLASVVLRKRVTKADLSRDMGHNPEGKLLQRWVRNGRASGTGTIHTTLVAKLKNARNLKPPKL